MVNIHSLLDRMESAEERFLKAEFLAPVLPGGRVRVRIAGVVCTLRVAGPAEPGWAILKPLSLNTGREYSLSVVGRPALRQIHEYLSLFPSVRLLMLSRDDADWLAWPAHRGDTRFRIRGPVPVHLASGVEPLQRIVARFDGVHFWFQEVDRRRSLAIAAYLREALAAETPPDALHKPTLTAEEREAYGVLYEAVAAARRGRVELHLAEALAHAGAELSSYIEREDAYTVSYTVDGRPYRSTVRKDDLTVLVAGICLSGQDRRFDLQSLVGVLREGAQQQRIVWVGGEDLPEDAYRQIHPADDDP